MADIELGKISKKYFKYLFFSIIGGTILVSAFLYTQKNSEEIHDFTMQAAIEEKYPRLANLFFKWDISNEEARELAKWDLVVIDMEAQARTPEGLRKLKEYNPDIKILAYITSQEFTSTFYTLRADSMRRKLYSGFSDKWWLETDGGGRVVWWPGTWLLNVTNEAPRNRYGQRWNEYLPEFIAREVLSTGFWDGVFYDNAWETASWLPSGGELDINNDGRADDPGEVDGKWQEGMRKIFSKTRQLAPGKIVMGNGGKVYASHLNGIAIEHFHRMDWSWGMNDYLAVIKEDQNPETTILSCNTENTGVRTDYGKMRYCLASSLLGDGYFSFDYGDQAHNHMWWYDEYDVSLGKPLGDAYDVFTGSTEGTSKSVWRRNFRNGIVLVNSTDSRKTINLEESFKKIYGKQDRRTNNGGTVSQITLDSQDGIILLRRDNSVQTNNFTNGSLAQVFNSEGRLLEDSFFIYYEKYALEDNILIDDLDNDGNPETIIGGRGKVEILNRWGARVALFYPYGRGYWQGINIATGDLNKDGIGEIVVSPSGRTEPIVKIFDKNGKMVHGGFHAYDPRFRGGVNIALGDLNNNGWREIITGAGKGGGPHIRIFSGGGRLIHPGFFAYGRLTRGGTTVATLDINGDGREEIVTGSGFGLDPEVKVFSLEDRSFKLKKYFSVFRSFNRSGINVSTFNFNSDNKKEILTSTNNL